MTSQIPPKLEYRQIQKFLFHRSSRGRVETVEVLRDLDLAIGDGLTAIVGPTGAGKSSALRLATRLDEPNGGTVHLDGADIRNLDVREVRRRVAFVAERHHLFGERIEENLTFGPRMAGVSDTVARERAVDVIERVGLDRSYLERRCDTLGASHLARVVLARALTLEPEVLLLDDIAARLEPDEIIALFKLLGTLAADGTTVVFTASRLFEARRFASRIVLLVGGEVVADRPAEDLALDAVPEQAQRSLRVAGFGGRS